MEFRAWTAPPGARALAILLTAISCCFTGVSEAADLTRASRIRGVEGQVALEWRSGHADQGEQQTEPTGIEPGYVRFQDARSVRGSVSELHNVLPGLQPASIALVVVLLAFAAAVVSWWRPRRSGPTDSLAPPKGQEGAHRVLPRKARAAPSVAENVVSEHEQLVRNCSDQLAYLGHELRTPVTAVVGMADTLSRADLTPDQQRCVDTILSSCDALTSVVDSFLDFSRIQSDSLVLDSADFDLPQLVDEALDMLSYTAHAKGLELEALVESDVPTTLRGDAPRLRQVLVNLLGNAVKFTESGHVFLRVRATRRKKGTVSLRFDVCDTGCGVSESKRSAIFEAFVRADVPEGQLRSGIGLGLYIARVLVQKMGGKIRVDGAAGVGSTFWFTASFETHGDARRLVPSTLPVARALPVLIVDDSPVVRNVLARYTEDLAMRPHATGDCADALDALRKAAARRDPFQMLFLDADMDGFEIMKLIEAVREDESLTTPELVMLTSLGTGLDPVVAALLGQHRELSKPLKRSQVEQTVCAILDDDDETREETLPIPVTHTETATAVRTGTSSTAADGYRLRILLAEDNSVVVAAVSQMLGDVGCDVDVVTDGRAAIRAARQTRYDAIFMDFQMPGLDGCQASREIHRNEGDVRLTPIIALTADAPDNIRERCLHAGMIDYLFKPVRARQLEAVLARHCRPERPRSRDDDVGPSMCAEDNPMAIHRLRALFIEDSQARLREMRQAARDRDWYTIAREAHGLLGSARVVGATAMSSACKSLEMVALSGDFDAIAALHEVETEFDRVRVAFEGSSEAMPPGGRPVDQDQRAHHAISLV